MEKFPVCPYSEKNSAIENDTSNRVIGIMVMRHISMGFFDEDQNTRVEMCQFTRISMTRFKVSFMMLNLFRQTNKTGPKTSRFLIGFLFVFLFIFLFVLSVFFVYLLFSIVLFVCLFIPIDLERRTDSARLLF